MGMSKSGYVKLERGDRRIDSSHIARAAEVFDVAAAEVLGVAESRMAPIVGLAGAGPDGSVLFATGDSNFGEVPAPIDSSPTTEALEVRGDSMRGLANDGWILFYEEKLPPSRDHLEEPCVCWLPDGRVLIKIPYPGSRPGLFNLESVNAATMRDQVVDAMAIITDIKTRRAASRFVKRNPELKVDDLLIRSE